MKSAIKIKPEYISIVATVPKLLQKPMFLHISTRVWGHPWYTQNIKTVGIYRKTSSISRTKFQNLNVSCSLLQLSLPNPLKPGVKLRMKM